MMANLQTHLRQAILFVFSCQTSKERWYVNIPFRKFSCPSAHSKHYVSRCLSYKQVKSHCRLRALLIAFSVEDFITLFGCVPFTPSSLPNPWPFITTLTWYVFFSVLQTNGTFLWGYISKTFF